LSPIPKGRAFPRRNPVHREGVPIDLSIPRKGETVEMISMIVFEDENAIRRRSVGICTMI
jgi:hypothetical protein